MARKHGVSRIEDLLPADLQNKKSEPHIEYMARTALPGIKPIVNRDPVLFLKTIGQLKQLYPNLKIYIFRVVKI